MIHIIGYSALIVNLISMAMNRVLYLRILSLIANLIYIIYGVLLDAPPFIIGCSIAVLIHLTQVIRILKKTGHNNVYKK